ncbi:MAG TPA: hypothetical protein PKK96_01325 [Anaerolineales bacterium]|nr:hypothetical protein [Anaerolineales bacterium]HMR97729.1 hypothetical protein [Anaerolineales bacterium]HNQ96097.1 hypothetical protein [Anaerolineales bacterium]HNS59617.1 hypothetical protein [Anaerolineales bacterium]
MWYSKSLGDGMWAPSARAEIERLFQPLFELAGKPKDMAVFLREEAGELHCEWIAYFSPASEQVAKAADARPCNRPAREGLSLLAGDEGCWLELFGDGY